MLGDFDHGTLAEVAHRPWPMPSMPWAMTQSWHDLLFAHWRVDAARLASLVPSPVQLDLFEGDAWVGVVPFVMTNVGPRGVPPLPGLSSMPELNVRTYVTFGGKPGVWFFSLDATNPIAVGIARIFFHLPYYTAKMQVERRNGAVVYGSRRAMDGASPADFVAAYRPAGPVFAAQPGTLDHFLTERYCLYTLDRRGRPLRVDIHHRPWPLQRAEADIELNTMAAASRIDLGGGAPLLHFAKRQDTVAWLPTRAV